MKKRKILFLSDHPLSVSGVGTQSRWIIQGLIATGKYSFRCLGAAIKHDSYDLVKVNEDFLIKPIDGFGDINMLRQLLVSEKPDAVLLFTDPRFFYWLWAAEDEIHQVCPIAYNHLWDNPPTPERNRVFYESTDLINCINWPTYEMVSKMVPGRANYVPHAIPETVFFPIDEKLAKQTKRQILGQEREDDFVVLFVGRNARRKCPSDVIASFKEFLDELHKKHPGKNATLVMHCDPNDNEGPNLMEVVHMLGVQDRVVFSKDRVDFEKMNAFYNTADVLVNASCNEGFGVPVLEMKMVGKPVIAIKTGGLTRQVEDHETGFQYGVAIEPDVRTLVGNQAIPYIYEDFASTKRYADAMMKVFEWGPEKRKEVGLAAREHAIKNYSIEGLIKKWDETLTEMFEKWEAGEMPNNKRWEEVDL